MHTFTSIFLNLIPPNDHLFHSSYQFESLIHYVKMYSLTTGAIFRFDAAPLRQPKVPELLVNLERPINFLGEPKTAQDTNRTTKEGEANRDHSHVRQIYDDWQDTNKVQAT